MWLHGGIKAPPFSPLLMPLHVPVRLGDSQENPFKKAVDGLARRQAGRLKCWRVEGSWLKWSCLGDAKLGRGVFAHKLHDAPSVPTHSLHGLGAGPNFGFAANNIVHCGDYYLGYV